MRAGLVDWCYNRDDRFTTHTRRWCVLVCVLLLLAGALACLVLAFASPDIPQLRDVCAAPACTQALALHAPVMARLRALATAASPVDACNAGAAVWEVAANGTAYRDAVLGNAGLPTLLQTLRHHPGDAAVLAQAVGALAALASPSPVARQVLVAQGGLPLLNTALDAFPDHPVLAPCARTTLQSVTGESGNVSADVCELPHPAETWRVCSALDSALSAGCPTTGMSVLLVLLFLVAGLALVTGVVHTALQVRGAPATLPAAAWSV